jgi:hypothetical protein
MSWTAGYHDTRGQGQDSGERDRVWALAWLLDQIDQRAMRLAADDEGSGCDDEVAELATAWRYFQQLPGERGGDCHERASELPPRSSATNGATTSVAVVDALSARSCSSRGVSIWPLAPSLRRRV